MTLHASPGTERTNIMKVIVFSSSYIYFSGSLVVSPPAAVAAAQLHHHNHKLFLWQRSHTINTFKSCIKPCLKAYLHDV